MKSTFSKFCCGLLSMITVLSLCLENGLHAEDALESDGVVRTINYSSEENFSSETEETGTAYAGHSLRNVPRYVGTKVEDVFQEVGPRLSPRRRLRYAHGPKWDAYTAFDVKAGNERSMGLGQVVVPLWQNGSSMLFADVRGQFDDTGAYEGNWGLGYRNIRDNSWILGAYGFYDRRKSSVDNYFSQVTFGIEALTVEWEARANVYLPERDPQNVAGAGGGSSVLIFGNSVIIRTGGGLQEQALYGVDAEVGKLLYEWGMGDTELRGFVSAFHFDSNTDGFPNVSGARSRLELRMYDLNFLGEGSRLNLAGEIQWDEVRDTQTTAMLRIQIPLGRKQEIHTRLQRRMLDRIVRDVDIVSTQTQGPSTDEEALNTSLVPAGTSFGAVAVVDGNTSNVPADVIAASIAGLATPSGNSTVFALDRAGNITLAAPIAVSPNQSLLGGGISIPVVGATTGTVGTLVVPGGRPTITGPSGMMGIDLVSIQSNASIQGIDFVGGNNIITGGAVNNILINNNTFTNAGTRGIDILNLTNGTISNNIITNSTSDGLRLGGTTTGLGLGPGGLVTNNVFDNNTNGVSIFTVVNGGTVTNNRSVNNSSDGFLISNLNAGGVVSNNGGIVPFTINGVLFIPGAFTNTSDGFQVNAFRNGSFLNSNVSVGNTGRGYRVTNITGGGDVTPGNTGASNTGGVNTFP